MVWRVTYSVISLRNTSSGSGPGGGNWIRNERECSFLMRERLPRSLNVVQSLAPENGGTSVSVPELANATVDTGRYRNCLLHFTRHGIPEVYNGVSLNLLQRPSSSLALRLPTGARASLSEAIQQADVVQVHGLWTGHCSASLHYATKMGKPVFVAC